MRRFITFSTLLVSLLSAAVLAHADNAAAAEPAAAAAQPVADYTVFLDPPTGFVFVKLPQGWKFVGKADGATLAGLPANVVTSLLPQDDAVVAQSPKKPGGKL